jgi:hypothetical protein
MRSVFTLTISLFFSISLFANAGNGKLSVATAGNMPVKIVIEGNMYYDRQASGNEVMLSDIRPGYHNIKVYKQSSRGRRKNNSTQMIYEGNIYIKPEYHVDVYINRFGKAFIDEKLLSRYYGNSGDEYGGYHTAMDNASFEQLKRTLANQSFDNTRMNIARQAIAQNYFTSRQVRELVDLFSFETSKLDIAKYSYANTIDRNNYYLISDALNYSSSRDELSRFIQSAQ